MGEPYLRQTLASQKANGTLFNTFTTAKSILNVTELLPIVGNFMQAGRRFHVHAYGGLSNIVTTPGTVTFQIMMGSVAVFTTGAIQMTTTANTLSPFWLDVDMRLDIAGSGTTAKFMGGGFLAALNLTIGSGANPTVTDTGIVVPVTAPADGTGFDSTVSEILDFWTGFSISNAGNGVQIYDYYVETFASGGT
jgi:hypothetical protein